MQLPKLESDARVHTHRATSSRLGAKSHTHTHTKTAVIHLPSCTLSPKHTDSLTGREGGDTEGRREGSRREVKTQEERGTRKPKMEEEKKRGNDCRMWRDREELRGKRKEK